MTCALAVPGAWDALYKSTSLPFFTKSQNANFYFFYKATANCHGTQGGGSICQADLGPPDRLRQFCTYVWLFCPLLWNGGRSTPLFVMVLGAVVQPSGGRAGIVDGWDRGSAEFRRPRQRHHRREQSAQETSGTFFCYILCIIKLGLFCAKSSFLWHIIMLINLPYSDGQKLT